MLLYFEPLDMLVSLHSQERRQRLKVKDRMIRKVATIDRDATIREALELMHKHSIRHLPVIGKGKDTLAGLVTESNLRQFYLLSMLERISVRDVMIVKPVTIDPNAGIELAAGLIYRHKVGCLPVVENGKLLGIITTTDILGAFIEMMGFLQASSRIDLTFEGDHGSIEDISRIVKENKAEIISIGIQTEPTGETVYHIRLEKCELKPITGALKKAGYEIISVVS